jgi:methionyl-tRNA formyltransferase
MAGDDLTGITIMKIILKLDAGDMLHKEVCKIEIQDTAGSLHDKLADLGAIGLMKVLPDLEAGKCKVEPQDESLVTYAEKLTKAEADLDWQLPAVQIARNVRGLNPWPVAQTQCQGQILRIWQAEALQEEASAEPGTVVSAAKNLDVATGDGLLRILEVQMPGGNRLPIKAFLNSHHLHGTKLG